MRGFAFFCEERLCINQGPKPVSPPFLIDSAVVQASKRSFLQRGQAPFEVVSALRNRLLALEIFFMTSDLGTKTSAPPYPENPPLSALEARVLGCLIEKEFSTPDIYPLSLNALVNACNQRNNRAPLLSVSAREVEAATDQLRQRRLVALFAGADARVPKFRQTLDTAYPLDPFAQALLGELLLRGPQTTAGLRANAERLQPMPELAEVELILGELANRAAGPLVRRLARQPGQKETRWAQLFTGEPAISTEATTATEPLTVSLTLPPETERRIQALEAEVAQLRGELNALRQALGS